MDPPLLNVGHRDRAHPLSTNRSVTLTALLILWYVKMSNSSRRYFLRAAYLLYLSWAVDIRSNHSVCVFSGSIIFRFGWSHLIWRFARFARSSTVFGLRNFILNLLYFHLLSVYVPFISLWPIVLSFAFFRTPCDQSAIRTCQILLRIMTNTVCTSSSTFAEFFPSTT